MAYEIGWQLEGRVIILRLWDVLTLLEAQAAKEKILEALEKGHPPIHMIVDMSKLHISPSGIQTNLQLTNYLNNPRLGWMVTLGGTPLTQFIITIIRQFIPFKYHQAESLEAALEFLHNQDSSLETLV